MFLFRKKQPVQEEISREPYLPPDLERFRAHSGLELPEGERKFRAFAREMENPAGIGFGTETREKNLPVKSDNADKIDMILQKLETIDLRLKVIEQKMERRPV